MIQGFDSDSPPLPDAGAVPEREPAGRDRDHRWWLLPVVLAAGFGLLLWQVKTHGPVVTLDVHVRDRLQHWARNPSMNWAYKPGRGTADLGNESITLPFLLVVTAWAARASRSWRPVLVALGALATLGTVILLKLWINRPGPGPIALGNANLGFFPSGHTADAVLCYGTSALLLCVFAIPAGLSATRARRLRKAIIAGATVVVLAVIAGLLWSNFHWLSDTIGSLCWCGAALAVLRRIAPLAQPTVSGPPEESEKPSSPG